MDSAKKYIFLFWLLCAAILLWALGGRVYAVGFYENPYIKMAPDGQAWTVAEKLSDPAHAKNHVDPPHWYPLGESFMTGIQSRLRLPEEGEHYYLYNRGGIIPIAKWQVVFRTARCIHPDFPGFHGMYYNQTHCHSSYYSGWNAWCADCGELLTGGHIYMSREKIRTLSEVDVDLDYYYDCPSCGHLEQGQSIDHMCKEISANRYRVVYHANAGDATGYMQPSYHMYGNADLFEGTSVTPAASLSRNSYQRVGYLFAGWNTHPYGDGRSFEDGQEILNLTSENYDPETGQGTVVLYAQWKKVSGTLIVDPGRGRYRGEPGSRSLSVRYGEQIAISAADVTPPEGALVSFETYGGSPVRPLRSGRRFLSWRMEQPAQGILQGETYRYLGEDGGTDRVFAVYQEEGIRLPSPVKQGYSFGGWYRDPECRVQAGKGGDLFVPSEDVTLYACWVDLVLDAQVNLSAHSGRGAVDLQWSQQDGKNKVYLLFQKREDGEFARIYDAENGTESYAASEFGYSGKEEIYRIPAAGLYELRAFGAQGQAYDVYEGGMGGGAAGTFYLEKGDRLTIRVGGQEGYGEGGDGQEYGKGGGRTEIVSEKLGTLLIAGGGGGASPGGNGGAGGLENGLWEEGGGIGQSGAGGGGGGFLGGIAGEYQKHIHSDACLHRHSGNAEKGGECYVLEKVEKTCHVRVEGPMKGNSRGDCPACRASGRYGSLCLYTWAVVHGNCGMATDYGSHGWWICEICGRRGYSYGSGSDRPNASSHTYYDQVYVLNCEKKYDCDEGAGVQLPSFGGSSYVNKEAAGNFDRTPGVQKGNGSAYLRPVSIGFQDCHELTGVEAADLKAPGKIEEKTVRREDAGNMRIRILFNPPEDTGTLYYHQAKSYLAGSEQMLCASNVTCTEVTTGIAGYYYRIDDSERCVLTSENADNRGNLLREPALVVEWPSGERYLHIAAADRAGNVGESISLKIGGDGAGVAWKLSTGQMRADGAWDETDYGSVLAAGEKTYYVKADGNTPFLLSYTGEMGGTPREDYQIDRADFCYSLSGDGMEGRYTILLPKGNFTAREELEAGQWGRIAAGNGLLEASMYGRAARTEKGRKLEICQSFTLDRKFHGWSFELTPVIGAAFGENTVFSDPQEDAGHGITLIGDGEPPRVYGMESLEQKLIDREERENLELDLWAEDDLSGVESFYAVLFNLDNHGEIAYYPGEDGHIRIDLSEDSPMFSGDLNLTVCAADGVGNEVTLEEGVTEFGVRAEIVRMLPPHTPEFKRGESGMLQVTVWGYADRLEIQFPEEFVSEDPFLDHVFEYAVPKEKQEEEIEFMIPLYLSGSREYSVTVRAFKGDRLLERRPVFCTLSVNDTVLRELRTRLR